MDEICTECGYSHVRKQPKEWNCTVCGKRNPYTEAAPEITDAEVERAAKAIREIRCNRPIVSDREVARAALAAARGGAG